jgi:hypothetical protein
MILFCAHQKDGHGHSVREEGSASAAAETKAAAPQAGPPTVWQGAVNAACRPRHHRSIPRHWPWMAGEDQRSTEKGKAVNDDDKRQKLIANLIKDARRIAAEIGTPEAFERLAKYERTNGTLTEKN